MLFGKSNFDAIIAGGEGSIVDTCEEYLTTDKLSKHLERGEPMTRKELCRYLDVGESTLTGWLKEDRIPRMAKLAIVLRLLVPQLKPLKDEGYVPRIVETDSGYQICEFQERDNGVTIGKVIATGIPDVHRARLLAGGIEVDMLRERGVRLLRARRSELEFLESYFEGYKDENDMPKEEKKLKQLGIELARELEQFEASPERYRLLDIVALLERRQLTSLGAVKILAGLDMGEDAKEDLLRALEIAEYMKAIAVVLGNRDAQLKSPETPEIAA